MTTLVVTAVGTLAALVVVGVIVWRRVQSVLADLAEVQGQLMPLAEQLQQDTEITAREIQRIEESASSLRR